MFLRFSRCLFPPKRFGRFGVAEICAKPNVRLDGAEREAPETHAFFVGQITVIPTILKLVLDLVQRGCGDSKEIAKLFRIIAPEPF